MIVAIGAPHNDGTGSGAGHVRVYRNTGTIWEQMGDDIDAEAASDMFGFSVKLSNDGNTLAIGGRLNDGSAGVDSGHVRVFTFDGTSWVQRGNDIDGEVGEDSSGDAIALSNDGTVIAIGARYNDDGGSASGHVRVYTWDGTSWLQTGSDIDGAASSKQFSGMYSRLLPEI